MKLNIKKALLAGTAIVAVGALAPAAQAADLTLTGAGIWGTLGNGMIAPPTAGDNVIMTTNNLLFDTTETGVVTAGAITATTGDLTVDTTGDAGNVAFTIGSFTGSSTADITVDNLLASTNRNVGLTVTGAVSTAGNIIVRNTETGANNTTVTTTVGGNFTVTGTGTTAVTTTGTGRTGVTATLDLNGTTNTFAGAVTVTGGAADATNDASLNIFGNTTFTGGLTLTNGAVGQAVLNVDGTSAQSVAGVIAGNGEINVTNTHASGVTFSGNSTHTGALLVNNNGSSQAVTFSGNNASAIALGNNVGADTITANFSGTAQAISGGITGGAAETVNANFSGGSTITLSGAATSGIDTTAITGSTTVTTNQNFGSTNITVGSGSTLITTGNTISGAVANSGTLRLNGGGVTGAVSGTGTLDVDGAGAFNGAMSQASADIAGVTLTQTAASGYTMTSGTNFSGAGTLALAAGSQTIGSAFTNTTDGQGTITVANDAGGGTTAFTGNVGASTSHSLAAFTMQNAGGNAQTVTSTGNWYVDASLLDASDTLSFIGTSAQTVSGTLGGQADNEGILNVGTGTSATDVTFSGVIGAADAASLASATVAASATARFAANADFDGAFTNTGTSRVSSGATLTAASFTDTGAYVLNVIDANGTLAASDFGIMVDSGGASTIANSRLSINVTGDVGAGTAASVLQVIDVTAPGVLTDNSIQYTFTAVDNGANTDITVARTTAASLAANTESVGLAQTMDGLSAASLAGTANAQIMQIADNLAAASTQDAFNEVLEAAGPTVDGGAVVGGFNASVQSVDVNNTRLASLRNGVETGMVAGELNNGVSIWAQGFGQMADQDRRDGIDGYDADTYGLAAGMDTANMLDKATVGVALSYATTDVDSDNANNTESDVDSYQVSLYGDYDVAPQTYVSGTLGFAWNDIDQTRFNVGGVSGLNANADYDSNQYIAYVETGREFEVSKSGTLTPHILAHYQHIDIDNYGEDGAGGANLTVNSEDLDIFELGVGAEMAWDLDAGEGSRIRPAINVGYRHDLVGDDVSSTSTFTGGGASFQTNGLEPSRGTGNIGASLAYSMDNNWTFTADYDYEIKSDYSAHSGSLRAGYKF